MSKKKLKMMILTFYIIFGTLFFLQIVYMLFQSEIEMMKKNIENIINVKIPIDSITLKEEDTHGGFLGDGDYFAEIQLSDDGYIQFINDANDSGKWQSLPLPPRLNAFLFGGYDNDIHYGRWSSEYLPNNISHGIYYLRDRYLEDYPTDENGFFDRYSYNFTFAIIDSDTKKLYIYALDT